MATEPLGQTERPLTQAQNKSRSGTSWAPPPGAGTRGGGKGLGSSSGVICKWDSPHLPCTGWKRDGKIWVSQSRCLLCYLVYASSIGTRGRSFSWPVRKGLMTRFQTTHQRWSRGGCEQGPAWAARLQRICPPLAHSLAGETNPQFTRI